MKLYIYCFENSLKEIHTFAPLFNPGHATRYPKTHGGGPYLSLQTALFLRQLLFTLLRRARSITEESRLTHFILREIYFVNFYRVKSQKFRKYFAKS